MKKVFVLIMALSICLVFFACGEESKLGNSNGDSSQALQTSKKDETTNTYEVEDLPGVVRANYSTVKYCINSPSIQIFNKGSSFVNMQEYHVIYDEYTDPGSNLNYNVDLSAITTPENVISGMKKQFATECSEGLLPADNYDYSIEKQENIKINQWNMCRTEGKLLRILEGKNETGGYTEADFVAYSLIKDGCPVYFAVVDVPDKSGDANIGEIADKIAKTFREYSED